MDINIYCSCIYMQCTWIWMSMVAPLRRAGVSRKKCGSECCERDSVKDAVNNASIWCRSSCFSFEDVDCSSSVWVYFMFCSHLASKSLICLSIFKFLEPQVPETYIYLTLRKRSKRQQRIARDFIGESTGSLNDGIYLYLLSPAKFISPWQLLEIWFSIVVCFCIANFSIEFLLRKSLLCQKRWALGGGASRG